MLLTGDWIRDSSDSCIQRNNIEFTSSSGYLSRHRSTIRGNGPFCKYLPAKWSFKISNHLTRSLAELVQIQGMVSIPYGHSPVWPDYRLPNQIRIKSVYIYELEYWALILYSNANGTFQVPDSNIAIRSFRAVRWLMTRFDLNAIKLLYCCAFMHLSLRPVTLGLIWPDELLGWPVFSLYWCWNLLIIHVYKAQTKGLTGDLSLTS